MCRVIEIDCYSTLLEKVYAFHPNLNKLLHILSLCCPFLLAPFIRNFLEAVEAILLRRLIQLAHNDLF